MKIKKYSILIICLVVLSLIFYSWYSILKIGEIVETKNLFMQVNVSNKLGLVVNDSIIDFGSIVPGTSIERKLSFSNTNPFELEVLFKSKGNISDFVFFSDFILESYETRDVPIVLLISSEVEEGFYSGELQVIFRRV